MAGTKVMATQVATARAATAEVLASSNCPSSAAAPEYSASRSATAKAARAKRKVRTGERSVLARRCAIAERAKLMGRTGHYAVRKYRHGEFLEVIRQAIIAAIEKSARLRRALQHQRTARTHA